MIIDYKENLVKENSVFEKGTLSTDTGIYVADFETSKVNETDNSVFVYATALMDVLDNKNICHHTDNIKDFITSISSLPTLESKIYFHNLSFDVVFILLELMENMGFTQIQNKYRERNDGGLTTSLSKKVIKKEVAKISKDDEEIYQIRPNSFNIIYNNGSFYRVDIYFNVETYVDERRKKKTRLRKVTLLDSYKLVANSLKNISKDFLDYDMPKDGIDHSIIRPVNYKLKSEEKVYLYEDVRILKEFINLVVLEGIHVKHDYKVNFNKLTIAGQSMNEYKTLLMDLFQSRNFSNNKAFKESFLEVDKYIKFCSDNGKKCNINEDIIFTSIFPQLHPNTDCYLRQSYFGGITFKNTKLINKLKENNVRLKGLVFDVNSLYPSVMRTKLLPYGLPVYYEGNYKNIMSSLKEEYPLYIQKIRVTMFKIKPNKMPNIQIRESLLFRSTDYQEDNSYYDKTLEKIRYEECIFTFTNVQLERFLDTYDLPLGLEYLDGYMMKGSYGIFDEYIDTFMELKKTGKGARRQTAKLMLNSLYGKYGTNPCREERIIDFENSIFSTTNKDDEENYLEYISDSIYLPMASFITSYAREVLLEAVNSSWDRFLYCDTDSLHVLGYEFPNIPIDSKELGYWDNEGKFINAKYIGAKRYAELIISEFKKEKPYKIEALNKVKHYKIKWDIKCCGISKDIISQLDDIETFDVCPITNINKEIENLHKKDDIYYYYDEDCTERVKGLIRSKKKKYVKGGILIQEQPYCITENMFAFFR